MGEHQPGRPGADDAHLGVGTAHPGLPAGPQRRRRREAAGPSALRSALIRLAVATSWGT